MFFLILLCIWHVNAHPIITYGFIPTTTTEKNSVGDKPKVIVAPAGNFSVTFVPLITLLVNAIPKIVEKFRPQTTLARDLNEVPSIPNEFQGRQPCIDSILIRKKYPGSDCHFYQCELYQPATALCRLQIIDEASTSIPIDSSSVAPKNIVVRISECLAIRIYKCSFGYTYSETKKTCVRYFKNQSKLMCS